METISTKEPDLDKAGFRLLTLDNPVFCCYLFWTSILILKMLMMSILTAMQRIGTKTFANPEDLKMRTTDEVKFNDPNVERVRRAHRNDMENILPLLIMTLIYIATGPNATLARILFRIAAVSRIVHTLVYAFRPVPQPTRAITFFTTFFITAYMAFYVSIRTITYI
ncbi:microsomal glutathione S-transferase 1-like [Teleopsis dalmanni]|uniref:microsomal glutathione S-transferase 1-like n=1 Tax=Teleopsis dalmanni TaxID=139649 RepID=UPI000D32944C|nr:microsomal glutathione S-transferase 1-like [Teleopsis dalmanni]